MQNFPEHNQTGMDRQEIIALSASSVVLVVALVYWVIQIRGVLEMLELAYG